MKNEGISKVYGILLVPDVTRLKFKKHNNFLSIMFNQICKIVCVVVACLSLNEAWSFSVPKPSQKLMKSITKVALSANIALLASGSPAFADAVPPVGSAAPEFTLPSNTGKDIGLSDLKGKRTVLYFYPGDFTSGCTIEAQGFEKNIAKFKEVDTQVVGVSVDAVDKHLDFTKKYGLDFPLLSDKGIYIYIIYICICKYI
jgi:peroxiredoxin Q/BCP